MPLSVRLDCVHSYVDKLVYYRDTCSDRQSFSHQTITYCEEKKGFPMTKVKFPAYLNTVIYFLDIIDL